MGKALDGIRVLDMTQMPSKAFPIVFLVDPDEYAPGTKAQTMYK